MTEADYENALNLLRQSEWNMAHNKEDLAHASLLRAMELLRCETLDETEMQSCEQDEGIDTDEFWARAWEEAERIFKNKDLEDFDRFETTLLETR